MKARLLVILLSLGAATMLHAQQDSAYHVIRGIILAGNKVTKEHIVLREMELQVGDTVETKEMYALLERSKNNLLNTSLFNTVEVLPGYLSSQDVLINVLLEERWYIWPIPIFEIAETNFNTWWRTKDFSRTNYGGYLQWSNFRGRRENLYLKLRFGYSKHFALRYQVPFVNKTQNLGFGCSVNYFQNREITVGTMNDERIFYSPSERRNAREVITVNANSTYRGGLYIRHIAAIQYNNALVDDTVTTYYPDYFTGNRKRQEYMSLSYTYQHDKRDVRAYPLTGHLAQVTVQKHGLGIFQRSAPVDLWTSLLTYKQYGQLKGRLYYGAAVKGKFTINTPPYYNQQALGYSNYVRGYEYYVIDGQHFGLFKSNLKYQVVKPKYFDMGKLKTGFLKTFHFAFYLNAFFDMGYVDDELYAQQNTLSNELMFGYGLGLDLVTVYDYIVRLELSRNRLGESGFFLHFTQPI